MPRTPVQLKVPLLNPPPPPPPATRPPNFHPMSLNCACIIFFLPLRYFRSVVVPLRYFRSVVVNCRSAIALLARVGKARFLFDICHVSLPPHAGQASFILRLPVLCVVSSCPLFSHLTCRRLIPISLVSFLPASCLPSFLPRVVLLLALGCYSAPSLLRRFRSLVCFWS